MFRIGDEVAVIGTHGHGFNIGDICTLKEMSTVTGAWYMVREGQRLRQWVDPQDMEMYSRERRVEEFKGCDLVAYWG